MRSSLGLSSVFSVSPRRLPLRLALLLCLVLLPGQAAGSLSRGENPCRQSIRSSAHQLLHDAKADRKQARQAALLLEANAPSSFRTVDCPLLLAEAWYRSADPDADIEQTYPIYEKVKAYAEKVLELDSGRTEARYWLGLAKLRKAQKVGGIRAFFIVWGAIDDLEQVREELPEYDQGGAARVLSLLYRVAPQWTPFGNMEKSVHYASDAVRASGDYALNRLYLARAYLGIEETAAAAEELRKIIAMPPNPFTAEARRQLAELDRLL